MQTAKKICWHHFRLPGWIGVASLLAGINPAPAHAYFSSAAVGALFGCANQLSTPLPVGREGLEGAKSSAILGGQPSALDLISAQQGGATATSVSYSSDQAQPAAMTTMLPCPLGAFAPTALIEPSMTRAQASGEFLGSSRVLIGSTPLDRAWRRVSRKSASVSAITYLGKGRLASDFDHVAKVNAWVNQNVEYAEDQAIYGQSDYWATANETLRRRKGDCEDFAILKYQFLVNAGFDPESIYLTLVWDTVRRREHAVLIVKLNGSHYLLDNETDQVLLADNSHEYSAKMSFSERSSWLHGYTVRPDASQALAVRRIAYFSDNAVSNARATGFNR